MALCAGKRFPFCPDVRYTKIMLLLTHITVAILGLLQATYALVSPSRRKLHMVYGLLAATLASGTYLVITLHSPILSSCLSGLLYTVVVAVLSSAATYRLHRQID